VFWKRKTKKKGGQSRTPPSEEVFFGIDEDRFEEF